MRSLLNIFTTIYAQLAVGAWIELFVPENMNKYHNIYDNARPFKAVLMRHGGSLRREQGKGYNATNLSRPTDKSWTNTITYNL